MRTFPHRAVAVAQVAMWLAFGRVLAWGVTESGLASEECERDMVYENHNSVEPDPLGVTGIHGDVDYEDPYGDVRRQGLITNVEVCVGVFSDPPGSSVFEAAPHRLVAATKADGDGSFDFRGLKPGRYRIVVRAGGYCTANSRLVLERQRRGDLEKRLKVHMRVRDLDLCSYVTADGPPVEDSRN